MRSSNRMLTLLLCSLLWQSFFCRKHPTKLTFVKPLTWEDIHLLKTENGDNWGVWHGWRNCSPNTFATGVKLKVELFDEKLDSTGVNAVSLYCLPFPREWGSEEYAMEIKSGEGRFGVWGYKYMCPRGKLIIGFQQRNWVKSGDLTSIDDVAVICGAPDDRKNIYIIPGIDPPAKFVLPAQEDYHAIPSGTERPLEPEHPEQEDSHIKMITTEHDPLPKLVGSQDDWSTIHICPKHYAVCGINSRIDRDVGHAGDDTSVSDINMKCCHQCEPDLSNSTTTYTFNEYYYPPLHAVNLSHYIESQNSRAMFTDLKELDSVAHAFMAALVDHNSRLYQKLYGQFEFKKSPEILLKEFQDAIEKKHPKTQISIDLPLRKGEKKEIGLLKFQCGNYYKNNFIWKME